MAYIYDLSDQWAASGTVFTGIKLNVTDTASAAGSLLADFQVGGVSKFKVPKNGNPVFVVPTSGFLEVNGNGDGLRTINGSAISSYGTYGIRMGASNTLSWGSTAEGPASAAARGAAAHHVRLPRGARHSAYPEELLPFPAVSDSTTF